MTLQERFAELEKSRTKNGMSVAASLYHYINLREINYESSNFTNS